MNQPHPSTRNRRILVPMEEFNDCDVIILEWGESTASLMLHALDALGDIPERAPEAVKLEIGKNVRIVNRKNLPFTGQEPVLLSKAEAILGIQQHPGKQLPGRAEATIQLVKDGFNIKIEDGYAGYTSLSATVPRAILDELSSGGPAAFATADAPPHLPTHHNRQ